MVALTPCKQKHHLKLSDNWTAILCLTREVVGKLAQGGIGDNFAHSCEQVERKDWDDNKKVVVIIIIIIFLHGLGRLTCSGIDALPSFPGASTISSSSRFVVKGVFRESGVVHFSRWLIQFCLCLSLTSCIPEISSSFLMTSLPILFSLVYPLTLLRKRISAASRRVMSRFVVTHVSLP